MAGFAHQENARSYMHRRGSVNIGNPAIIIHRSYRKPGGENDSSWQTAIEMFASFVGGRLKSVAQNALEGRDLWDVDAQERASLQHYEQRSYDGRYYRQPIRAGAVKVTSVIDIFDEFWTSKLVIDFSRTGDGEAVPNLFSPMLSCLDELEELIEIRYRKSSNASTPEATSRTIRQICSRISGEIGRIEGDVIPASQIAYGPVVCNAAQDLFADFIGFSLACPGGAGPSQLPLQLDGHAKRALPRREEKSVPDNIRPASKIPADGENLMAIVDAVWPVAVELNPYRLEPGAAPWDEAPKAPPREFTISRLNRGRALYVTSLGAVPRMPNERVSFPLSYLLLCPHRATWQIGRMIDRIHSLGVFRLASLLEHDAVDRANETMRRLIDELEERDVETRNIRSELVAINRDFDSGLHYRTEWSRYYLKIYESLLRGTKFQRVEGYQTYEEFVRRRIGSYFEAIESTSRRFVYLSRLLTERANQRTSESSKRLLEVAELVSALPVAYYSYDVFVHLNERLMAYVGPTFPWSVDTFWMAFSTLYAAVVARNLRPLLGPWFKRQRMRFVRFARFRDKAS